MNPLDLDEEFNFIEWRMERSVRDPNEIPDDADKDDVRSQLAKDLKQEHQLNTKMRLYDFLALEK